VTPVTLGEVKKMWLECNIGHSFVQEHFFSTGGTLAPDDPSYIERAADFELEKFLRSSQYVSLLDARQKGKSSLVARVIRKLSSEGFLCIKIDLQRFGSNLSESQWCAGIAATIEQQSGDKTFLKRFTAASKSIGTVAALFNTIASLVDSDSSPHTIVFCDEIDFVRVLLFPCDGFFAAIRSLYNERSSNPNLNRLTFCLIGSASPNQLVQSQSTAPFDIAKTVILQDFSLAETHPYAQALPAKTEHPRTCIEQIHYWCAGHPFLTQTICSSIALDDDPSPNRVNAIIFDNYLANNSIEKNAHLNQIANAFLQPGDESNPDLVPAALDTYRLILKSPQDISKYRKEIISHLRICGLININDGIATPRNRIYTRVFNHVWIKANLPAAEQERQRVAARNATLKTSAVAATIVGIMAWLSFSNINLANRAQSALGQSQINEARAERQAYFSGIQVAGNQVQTGNWIAASKNITHLANAKARGWEWYYLHQILNQQISSLEVGEPIVNVTSTSNNRDFIALGRNELITLKGQSIEKSPFPYPDYYSRRLSPDGQYIVLRGSEPGALIVNIAGKLIFKTPHIPVGFSNNSSYFVAFNSGGKQIDIYDSRTWRLAKRLPFTGSGLISVLYDQRSPVAVICKSTEIYGIDAASNQIVWKRKTPIDSKASVLSLDGKSIFHTFAEGPVERWSRSTGKTEMIYGSTKAPLTVFSESPSQNFVATGGGDGIVKVYDSRSPNPINTFVGHAARISGIWFANNETTLVTTSEDGSVREWNLATQSSVRTIRFPESAPMSGVISENGDRIALGNMLGTVGLMNSATGELLFRVREEPGIIPRIGFTSRDEYVFLLSQIHGFQLRSSLDGRLVRKSAVFSQTVLDFKHFDDGQKQILFTLGENGELFRMVDYKNPTLFQLSNPARTSRLGLSPDGNLLAVGHQDGTLTLLDAQSGKEIGIYALNRSVIRSIQFSHDSKHLATASNDETGVIFDTASKTISHRLVGHTSRVYTARFSPDDSKVLTVSFDGTVRTWDSKTGAPIHTLQHDSWVSDAEFSPDGNRIISGGNDRALHVWDTDSGQELLALGNHNSSVFRTIFTQKGRTIVTMDGSGTVTFRQTSMPTKDTSL